MELPRRVRVALNVIWLQVALGVVGLLVLADLSEGAAGDVITFCVSVAATVLLVVATRRVHGRRRWAVWVVLGVEFLQLASCVVLAVSSTPYGIVGMVLPLIVLIALGDAGARAWSTVED
ncbi:hypothetical protein [Actinokineospora sp. NBRC 105648]|uniref:hypothetical protein n=1 Tax=Actinokineospora sp. NBRC 105648 TaxID=3032206 RepID=UPI0025534B32|nr:hypothetical protein [Actinokineospora sp. NBRC 105648]